MLACGKGWVELICPPLSGVLLVRPWLTLLAGFLTCLVSVSAFRVLGCGLMGRGSVLITPSLACSLAPLSPLLQATSLTLCCKGCSALERLCRAP